MNGEFWSALLRSSDIPALPLRRSLGRIICQDLNAVRNPTFVQIQNNVRIANTLAKVCTFGEERGPKNRSTTLGKRKQEISLISGRLKLKFRRTLSPRSL